MTSHLLYEGPELEQLLEQVRSVHGPSVTIISANKVRRGGVAGFFAQEIFQVTVDSEPPMPEPAVAMPSDATQSAAMPSVATQLIEDETIEDEFPTEPIHEEQPAEPFADMLDRLVTEKMLAEALAARATATSPAPAPAPAATVPVFPTVPAPVPVAPVPMAPLAAPLFPTLPAFSTAPAAAPPAAPLATPSFITSFHPRSSTPLGTGTGTGTDAGSAASVIALRPHRVRRSAGVLGGLDELISQFENGWIETAPLPATGVVIIVGNDEAAHRVATSTASSLGIEADEVVVASPHDPHRLPTAGELTQLARALADRGPRSILVIELVAGIAGHEWARAVISGLRPARVNLAIDAGCGYDELRRTVTALGGIDAIDLLDVAASHHAEELLEMNIPIATLDGRDASPALWAATVLSRPGASVVTEHSELRDRHGETRRSLGSPL